MSQMYRIANPGKNANSYKPFVWCLLLASILSMSACQNSDVKQEQLNNNGSGMDQDHTAAPPDTLPLVESQLGDTLSVQPSVTDTSGK